MEEATRLKKVLKQWESAFHIVHERKPGKSDVDSAPDHIKDAYKEYSLLKKKLSAKENVRNPEDATNTDKCMNQDSDKLVFNKSTDRVDEKLQTEHGIKDLDGQSKCEPIKSFAPKGDMEPKDELFIGKNKQDTEGTENTKDKAKEPEFAVWDCKFDRKSVAKRDNIAPSGGGEQQKKQPAFLEKLSKNMFAQSLKNKGVPASVKPWRKPDTPRRGLLPPDKPILSPSDMPMPVSNTADGHSPSDVREVKNMDETDGMDTTADIKNEESGSQFLKPSTFKRFLQKSETKELATCMEDSSETSNDVCLNKFQVKMNKKSILPSSLAKAVDRHKLVYNVEEDLNEDHDNIGEPVKSFHSVVEDDDDDDDVDHGGSGAHSWNMPVSKLITDDEVEFKKSRRKAAKTAKQSKPSQKPAKIDDSETSGQESNKGKNAKVKAEVIGNDSGSLGRAMGSNEENMQRLEPVSDLCANKPVSEAVFNDNKQSKPQTKAATVGRRNRGRPVISDDDDDDDDDESDGINKGHGTTSEFAEDDEYQFNETESKNPARKPRVATKLTGTRKRKMPEVDDDFDNNDRDDVGANVDGDVTADTKPKARKGKAEQAVKKRKTNTGAGVVTVGDDDESTVNVKPAKKPAPRAKAPSNENFIRLNMKLKTYKRKGRQMTGPQYKRKMWKEKMAARSKSYGDKCFKCGQSGHWANKCTGAGMKANVYDKEPVSDADFPSLQEAANMARGSSVQAGKPAPQKPGPSRGTSSVTVATSESGTEYPEEDEDVELELQSGIVRSHREQLATPPAMEPLLACGEGETLPRMPDAVWAGLRKFGFETFRPGQEEAVMRILCGLSTLVVLSTGGGKSLCYQLPAYLYARRSPCITLVISPLVSLMEDQVTGLPQGIRGVCLHTNMTPAQRENVLSAVKDGNAHFLLVSPEAVAGGSMSLISQMSSLPPVAFVCIDEAHCLSEWSHNFRPSYLRLCKVLYEKLGIQCFLGLTATATLSTACDVSRHLRISDFKRATVRGSPIPQNLMLSVSKDENREEALIGLLKGERFGTLDSIIIYCTRRDQTDKVATIIRTCMNTGPPLEKLTDKGRRQKPKLEWSAESYHAGLTPAQRKRVQNSFMSGKLRVVAATVAFGMGLDKSDVRGIIHYNMPKSFESYVQEIGRAGRDGKRADCHVFLDPEGHQLVHRLALSGSYQ